MQKTLETAYSLDGFKKNAKSRKLNRKLKEDSSLKQYLTLWVQAKHACKTKRFQSEVQGLCNAKEKIHLD